MDAYPDQKDTYASPEDDPRPRKHKRSNTGLYLLLIIAIGAFVTYMVYTGGFLRTGMGKMTTESITNLSFNGKVSSFTFDANRHNTKIAILTDGTKYAIYDQWVYDIELGDSLVKEKNTLVVNVYKPKKAKVVLDYFPILRKMEIKGW